MNAYLYKETVKVLKHFSTALAVSTALTTGVKAATVHDFSMTEANRQAAASYAAQANSRTNSEQNRWWYDFTTSGKNIVDHVADISVSNPKAAMWFLLTGGRDGFSDREATPEERSKLELAMKNVAIEVYKSSRTAGAEMWKDLTEKYNQGHAHVQMLYKEVADLRELVRTQGLDITRLNGVVANQSARIGALETEVASLRRENGELRGRIQTLEERLAAAEVKRQNDLAAADKRYRELQDEADKRFDEKYRREKEESERRFNKILDDNARERERFFQSLERGKEPEKGSSLVEKLEQEKRALEALREKEREIERANREVLDRENKIAKVNFELEKAQYYIDRKTKEIADLQRSIDKLTDDLNQKDQTLGAKDRALQTAASEKSALEARVNALSGEVTQLTADIDSLQNTEDTLKRRVAELEGTQSNFLETIDKQDMLLETYRKDVRKLTEKLGRLKERFNVQDSESDSDSEETRRHLRRTHPNSDRYNDWR